MYSFENIPKHKVFISFHHQDNDYHRRFEQSFSADMDVFVRRSVQDGDIDPNNKTETVRQQIRDEFISDTTVTIVLIGAETWKRKHVDWEIGYSLRNTGQNTRSGLIGILLPSYNKHRDYFSNCSLEYTDIFESYTPCNIPPRLYDNIKKGYAKIYSYPRNATELKRWIHEAFLTRKHKNPDNARPYFGSNRSEYKIHWAE